MIAPTCLMAEVLATTLTVLGSEKGIGLIETLPDIEALLIAKDMKEYRSTDFEHG